ncbi:unnamed protein product [Tilletia laevis]|uniref:Major facilitator superfamily (MFS) profile domain-containing protein n=3 Tax=Tilletia TaxID=13289 RepID=A0A8X7MZI3_9BASI|nr:hypothetical protein CF328_g7305 [Tilletia controversa]KAE8247255.1 hypothetical protein A4X03_0g7095 [Tilletia caries]CAD6937360.1 unnamed protein product [Tilletia laevis]KAE8253444.1 hypothetical protein A4X06_0g1444 [Tilletia controversa]CAD6892230.1 unnamed protein product [Tilletia caries]
MSSDLQADARSRSESQPQAEGITNAPSSEPTATQDPDVEAAGSMPTGSLAPAPAPEPVLDIEHQLVDDDPRLWSSHQKAICVATLMLGALSPTLGASIFLPALQSLQAQLNASNATISLAVSLYILFQGTVPLLWSSISELIGRKSIFIAGSIIFAVTSLICGLSNSVGVLVAMRCISAIGSSPMLSIGAGTLADLYEPHQRGVAVGLWYSAPLLAPAIAPIIGGALTEAASWRATFYFLAAAGALMVFSFIFLFKETFRPARSMAWTQAKERALRRAEAQRKQDELHPEKALKRKAEQARREQHPPLLARLVRRTAELSNRIHARTDGFCSGRARHDSIGSHPSSEATVVNHHSSAPHRERPDEPFEPPQFFHPAPMQEATLTETSGPVGTLSPQNTNARVAIVSAPEPARSKVDGTKAVEIDTRDNAVGSGAGRVTRGVSRTESRRSALSRSMTNRVVTATGEEITFKPSFADVNPLRPLFSVLSEPYNIASLIASGLSFGAFYSLSLTLTRTLSAAPGSPNGGYGYSPIIVGCVLLCVGAGGVIGSIVGGRLSDRRLRRVKSGAIVSPLISPTSVDAAAWRSRRTSQPLGAMEKDSAATDVEAEGADQAPEVVVEPEERLLACRLPMLFVPITYIAYGWAVQYSAKIAAVCVTLVLLGTAQFSVYACTLSYVVDSNKGRGSSAVACNSAFRGSVAFVASEIAIYLLNAMGNGWLYTGWALALGFTQLVLFFVAFQGPRWRRDGFRRQQDWRFLSRRNWKA